MEEHGRTRTDTDGHGRARTNPRRLASQPKLNELNGLTRLIRLTTFGVEGSGGFGRVGVVVVLDEAFSPFTSAPPFVKIGRMPQDRKSTRLNSSHVALSR